MEIEQLMPHVEALIFASERPLPQMEMIELLGNVMDAPLEGDKVAICLEAVKEAKKTGKIKLVSFDENDGTLQGVIDGYVYGTVSQQPYYYGYHSVRILAALIRGDNSVLPPNKFLEVPIKVVKKDNVQSFWAELKKLREG